MAVGIIVLSHALVTGLGSYSKQRSWISSSLFVRSADCRRLRGNPRHVMQIDLRRDDAEMLRDLLRQRIVELDKEINRTDSLAFKQELQQLDRAIERVVGQLSTALQGPAPIESSKAQK